MDDSSERQKNRHSPQQQTEIKHDKLLLISLQVHRKAYHNVQQDEL